MRNIFLSIVTWVFEISRIYLSLAGSGIVEGKDLRALMKMFNKKYEWDLLDTRKMQDEKYGNSETRNCKTFSFVE